MIKSMLCSTYCVPLAGPDQLNKFRNDGSFLAKFNAEQQGDKQAQGETQDDKQRGRDTSDTERQVRPGDWTCPKCRANVFASRSECFKCRTPKSSDGEPPRDSRDRDRDRDRDRVRDRDRERDRERDGDKGRERDRYRERERDGDREGGRTRKGNEDQDQDLRSLLESRRTSIVPSSTNATTATLSATAAAPAGNQDNDTSHRALLATSILEVLVLVI